VNTDTRQVRARFIFTPGAFSVKQTNVEPLAECSRNVFMRVHVGMHAHNFNWI
jgi:hypothetical protein